MEKKDFFEIKKLVNLTNDFDLLKNRSDEVLEAIEYGASSIGFNVPHKTCNMSQLVNLEGVIHMGKDSFPFVASGKITELNSLGKNRIRILVELHTFDKILWKKFLDNFQKQVSEVQKLFSSMKGDE